MPYRFERYRCHKYQIRKNKNEEVFVIAVAETVIYKRTVMVEVFNTAATKHTMEGSFGLYYFVVGAKVNEIEISIQELFR